MQKYFWILQGVRFFVTHWHWYFLLSVFEKKLLRNWIFTLVGPGPGSNDFVQWDFWMTQVSESLPSNKNSIFHQDVLPIRPNAGAIYGCGRGVRILVSVALLGSVIIQMSSLGRAADGQHNYPVYLNCHLAHLASSPLPPSSISQTLFSLSTDSLSAQLQFHITHEPIAQQHKYFSPQIIFAFSEE